VNLTAAICFPEKEQAPLIAAEGCRTGQVITAEAAERKRVLKLGTPAASWWLIEVDR
jgi:hypothetical protein